MTKIIFLTLLALFASVVSVRFALVSKKLLDAALIPAQRENFASNLILLAVLVACQLIVNISYTLLALKTEGTLKNRIQSSLFNKLLYKKWQSVSAFHSGEVLNRLNGDVNIIASHLVSVIPTVFALVSKIALSFVALCMLDGDFALIFLVVGPVVMIVARIYSSRIKPLSKKCMESQGRLHSFLLESFRNLLVIKSFGVEEMMTEKAQGLQKYNLSLIMKRGFLNIFANILFYISLTIGYYFAVAWCAWKIANALMTVGTFAAIIQLVGQIQTPFKDLASVFPQVYAMIASAERITELEELPDEEGICRKLDTDSIYNNMEYINISSVSFAYNNEEKIFQNANARLKKGSLVAVSGISGIGKSTLLKLIMGILSPDAGEISMVCGENKYACDASMRGLFAYVPQGNMILSGSVRENIAFANSCASDEEIESAARCACIWDAISAMPEGLDTKLGEGGMGLSEGQIQRLAVARAICSKAPILLLDESTSALDEQTEKQMLSNIMQDKERTCIIISHKECAFGLCDVRIDIEDMNLHLTEQHRV